MKCIFMSLATWGIFAAAFAADTVETYSSKEHDFTLQYPAQWEKKERVSGAAVTLLAPKEGKNDTFRANVNVVEQDVPSGTDLKKFSDASLSVMVKLLKGYKESFRGEISIGAIKAMRVDYTFQVEDRDVKVVLVLAVSGKHGYAISGTANEANAEAHMQAFMGILNSFKPL